MPRGRLEIQSITHLSDREPTYQADFLTEDSDRYTVSVRAEELEGLLYEKLRLELEIADRLLNGVRNAGRAAVDGIRIGAADLTAAAMDYLRNDAA